MLACKLFCQILEFLPVGFIHPDIDVVELQPVQRVVIRLDNLDIFHKIQELIPLFLEELNRPT